MLIQKLVDMDFLKTIIFVILSISAIVFIALFGRLPIFRKTPIAFLHKLLTKSLPNAFIKVDSVLTGRRLSNGLYSTGHYLMYEKHPIVLIFFVLLQTGGEAAMIPPLWPTLPFYHKLLLPILISLPHYFLYLTATDTSSAIAIPSHLTHTPTSSSTKARRSIRSNHQQQPPQNLDFGPSHHAAHHAYPYDYLLYHPGYFCSTCHIPKPARSKHCSLCKACIQKADHHCIWVNNCVGRNNYLWFLLLLVAITTLLVYGCYLGWGFMRWHLDVAFATKGGPGSAPRTWSQGTSWMEWFDRLAYAMMQDVRVGATTLLCLMTTPLGGAFLVYHAYLLWAGMTTNEQGKWSDWKEDVNDGVVFRAEIEALRRSLGGGAGKTAVGLESLGRYPPLPREVEPVPEEVDWPPRRLEWFLNESAGGGFRREAWEARWWYIRTRDGEQPALTLKEGEARARGVEGGDVVDGEVEVDDHRWKRVKSMRTEMDNIYDLGFWGNLMEVVYHRQR